MKKRAKNFRIHLTQFFESLGYKNNNLIDKDEDGVHTYLIYTSYFNSSTKIKWGTIKSNTKEYKKYLNGFMEILIAQIILYNNKSLVEEDCLSILFISSGENIVVTLDMIDRSWTTCNEGDW